MTVYQANFAIPVGAAAPDQLEDAGGSFKLADDVVVSRYADGSPASRFGDLVWDMSPYHPDGRAAFFYFGYWGDGHPTPANTRLSREMREITGLLMWKRVGNPYSLASLRTFVRLLWPLAEFAEEHECSIAHLLNNLSLLQEFVSRHPLRLTPLSSILGALAKIGPQGCGFDVIGQAARAALGESVERGTRKQHPPIPTRIYSQVLTQLAAELADWRAVAEPFLAFALACTQDRNLGRADNRARRAAVRRQNPHLPSLPLPPFTDLLEERGLASYFAAKGLTLDVTGLVMGLLRVQMAAKLTIQAFTGMRDDEATSLPLDCLDLEKSGGAVHFLVKGRTTKFNDGRAKATRWITNQDGHLAVTAAQTVARIVYQATGRDAESSEEARFLFVSPGHLGMTHGPRKPTAVLVPGSLKLVNMPDLRARLTPLIQEEDLLELEQIDPHRAWRAEPKFRVGQPWPLTSHQYRRSLALYAQRSGLVSLPSLRRQLQHLTEEMTRYYQKGSVYARNFIGDDKDHFGLEWQQAQAESSALGYILNVLLSNDVLFGGHANWVDHRLRGPEGVVAVDRAQTMRRFKKGELAYRETAIGGCTNVKGCDKPTLRFLDMECLRYGCANMVGNLPKLERVIAGQEARLATIEPDSMEYHAEREELNILIATRDRVTAQLKR